MIKFLMNKFSISKKNALQLIKASFISFMTYATLMLPAILLMMFANDILINKINNKYIYIIFSIISMIFIYILLGIEYDNMYKSTYKQSADLRIEIANKLLNLPISYFSKHDLSDLSQAIMRDAETFEHAFGHSLIKIGGLIIFLPLLFFMLFISNVTMAFSIIIPTLFSFIFIPLSKKISIKSNQKYYDTLRENSEMFQEAIEMQQEIKSFNLGEKVKDILFKKIEESEIIHIKTELTALIPIAISNFFSYVSVAISTFVGIHLFYKGEITILYLIGFLLVSLKLKEVLDSANEEFMELYYLVPSLRRLKEIKKQESQLGDNYNIKNFDIEFKNVSFSYNDEHTVLNNVSFKIPENKVTALVGISGCGKTSVLRLISRFFDYNKGSILIDGKEINKMSTKNLFKKISIVFQDVTLFNTSILENVRIGNINASDEEVIKALELANCNEFIENLKDGVNTLIGENGANLSGGQRQRLSIARAFLKNSPILILDELGANLDIDNESKIQESLNRLIKNKTVIIISHRLKSIENVDNIIVIDKGTIECSGNSKYILEHSKIYKELNEKTKLVEEFEY